MRGTQVWSLVQEDSTCRGATNPRYHNYWSLCLEPTSHNYWGCLPRICVPQQEKPLQWEAHKPQWSVAPTSHMREACTYQQRLSTSKSKNKYTTKMWKKTKQNPVSPKIKKFRTWLLDTDSLSGESFLCLVSGLFILFVVPSQSRVIFWFCVSFSFEISFSFLPFFLLVS